MENELEGKLEELVVICSFCSTCLDELKKSKKISVCRQRLERQISRKQVKALTLVPACSFH